MASFVTKETFDGIKYQRSSLHVYVYSISIMLIVYFNRTFELFKMKNLPYSYDIQFLDAFKMKMRDVPEQLMTTMMYHGKIVIHAPSFEVVLCY